MDRIKLLCDIGELNHLFRDSISVEGFMDQTVEMVARHMDADVCSIYIYDDDEEVLVLKATHGLNPDAVGKVALDLGQGLTGTALKELRPICVCDASNHPLYKFFPNIDEEPYENFLAVPILRGVLRIGVLVLQRKARRRHFEEEDILACKAVASQLANIIENAKFLMTLHVEHAKKPRAPIPDDLKFVRGKVASEGFAYSRSLLLDKDRTFEDLRNHRYEQQYTLEEFEQAVDATGKQLEDLQKQVEEKLSDAASLIFASHLLILKDHEYIGTMKKLIEEGVNPPEAVIRVTDKYMRIFKTARNTYVQEKVQDLEDLATRLLSNIEREVEPMCEYRDRLVIARELFPSDLLRMSGEKVAGIVLVTGGVTSHLSILARSLKIPMVIASRVELLDIPDETMVLIDADTGNVYVEPGEDVVQDISERKSAHQKLMEASPDVKPKTHTRDGSRIRLLANINLLSDLTLAQQLKCEGVGLYRTEFPFIIRSDFPTEEEQLYTYRKVVESMKGRPVTFRTLDIGGDKVLSYYHHAREQNPSLGLRSIRFSLQKRDIFYEQIAAMLRAGRDADLRIMFPMISSMDEFMEARECVLDCIRSLGRRKILHNDKPKIGMMIELPSVINLLDAFAEVSDFFSIGSNDFIQFMLGVDRTNENVSQFYLPCHPAVMRALEQAVEAADEYEREISICGDMAHQQPYVQFLLGIGMRVLSLDPAYIPRIQHEIEEIDLDIANEIAAAVLAEHRIEEIRKILCINEE